LANRAAALRRPGEPAGTHPASCRGRDLAGVKMTRQYLFAALLGLSSLIVGVLLYLMG
jgi:hypothetical protein